MDKMLFYKILKYIAQISAAFLIFKFVPKQPFSTTTILIIIAIIMLIYLVFEYLTIDNIQPISVGEKINMCNSICSNNSAEHLTNIQKPADNVETNNQKPAISIVSKVIKNNPDTLAPVKIVVNQASDILVIPKKEKDNSKVGTGKMDSLLGDNMDFGLLDQSIPYTDFNQLPVSDVYDIKDFEYGYSFIPPEKWYPQAPNGPVCTPVTKALVCPSLTTGSPTDVKEWRSQMHG
jgi:hypothetical protein